MSTIRPFLSSGVRIAVVPDDHPSDQEPEEVSENADFSDELEGSCELMSDVTSDAANNQDQAKREDDERKSRRLRKRWEDYFDSLNIRDDD